jgi:hypothetical protein
MRWLASPIYVLAAALAGGCSGADPGPPARTPAAANATAAGRPATHGLLVALAQFEVTPEGKALPEPRAARLEVLRPQAGPWEVAALEDPESNVFHKAMVFDPGTGGPGILTLGGSGAALKLWRPGPRGLVAETLWRAEFGGKFSRMRDAEVADSEGGRPTLAVATHDQGVVALVATDAGGKHSVRELDRRPSTFVHEIEVGDLDGDGVREIYATPSEPNQLTGKPQRGEVVRYVPARGGARAVVADLGERHAKEILVSDVDGDGRDELYVSVEAVSGGQLEIRRFDAGTDPRAGAVVARLDDRLCRFLVAGDVDGDGRRGVVAAALRSGLWLLRPPAGRDGAWSVTSIDRDSSGFEHAALLADLDGDTIHELYVASDDQGEIRRYVLRGGRFERETIRKREIPDSVFTWNLMPVPLELVRGMQGN